MCFWKSPARQSGSNFCCLHQRKSLIHKPPLFHISITHHGKSFTVTLTLFHSTVPALLRSTPLTVGTRRPRVPLLSLLDASGCCGVEAMGLRQRDRTRFKVTQQTHKRLDAVDGRRRHVIVEVHGMKRGFYVEPLCTVDNWRHLFINCLISTTALGETMKKCLCD